MTRLEEKRRDIAVIFFFEKCTCDGEAKAKRHSHANTPTGSVRSNFLLLSTSLGRPRVLKAAEYAANMERGQLKKNTTSVSVVVVVY